MDERTRHTPAHEEQWLNRLPSRALQSQPQLRTPQPAPACEHQSAHGQTQLQQAREVPPPVAAVRARQGAPEAKAAATQVATADGIGEGSGKGEARGPCMVCGAPGGAVIVMTLPPDVQRNQLPKYFMDHILQTGPSWLNLHSHGEFEVLACPGCHADYRGTPAALRRQEDDIEEEAAFQRAIEASLALEQPGAAEELDQEEALRRT